LQLILYLLKRHVGSPKLDRAFPPNNTPTLSECRAR